MNNRADYCRHCVCPPTIYYQLHGMSSRGKCSQVDLHANVDGLSSSGLNVHVEARITNPNPVTWI